MMEVRRTKTKSNPKYPNGYLHMIANDIRRNKYVYIMAIPVILFYAIFHYKPMYGAIIAFKDFAPGLGIIDSPWVGFKHFKEFFTSIYFWRVLKNTLLISVYELVWGFPAPILLALLLNEIRNKVFKSTVQTLTYLPHFISLVVICGMVIEFTSSTGVINDIITWLGGSRTALLQNPKMFRPVYIISGIWQHIGWDSIIYLAALSGIDPEQYEAASIDGCGRFKKILHVTLPGIASTIIILLILRMGKMLNVGFEKIILLYNPATYETADVISSFVYRKGLQQFDWSFSSAVGLFNSLINFALIIYTNKASRKVSETSLW
jgi:putative aldouronate transport system permease protein